MYTQLLLAQFSSTAMVRVRVRVRCKFCSAAVSVTCDVRVRMLLGVGSRLYSAAPGSDLKYRNGSVAIGNALFGPSVFAPHAFAKRSEVCSHYVLYVVFSYGADLLCNKYTGCK